MRKLLAGSRGSQLALLQTEFVVDIIKKLLPNCEIEIQTIHTSGDKMLSAPFTEMVGKGFFTKEIEEALIRKEIDFAVHSLKDLPTEMIPELAVPAFLEREDPSDVLVTESGKKLQELPAGATVGTSSPRRIAWVRELRPDLEVRPLRGNIQTRLNKVFGVDLKNREDKVDAAVLAMAGLKRLDCAEKVSEVFDPREVVPAPGQGALAVQCRREDAELISLLEKLNHEPTSQQVQAERSFLSAWGGGCSVPLGAFASQRGEKFDLVGAIYSEEKKRYLKETLQGSCEKVEELGKQLAEELKKR